MMISFDTILFWPLAYDAFCCILYQDEIIDDDAHNAMIRGGVGWYQITPDFCDCATLCETETSSNSFCCDKDF